MKKDKKLKKELARLHGSQARQFQALAIAGFQSVCAGEHTLEEWLVDIEPLAKSYHARLVVVLWPKSGEMSQWVPSAPGEPPSLNGWMADLDFVFDEPPFTVSTIRQPHAPEWMSKSDDLIIGGD